MKYPIGIQDFEKLRTNEYSYVDKSRFVYKLATEGEYYFLSRPRRFGKSLFLSTLEAYFQGKKELFEGLAIYDLETEWKKYPIFHIDLNTANFREKDSLYNVLNDYLTGWEDKYGTRDSEVTLPLRFKGVIARAAEKEGCGVVILIDEYDKPILQTLRDPELQAEHRAQLKAFYSVLKTQDRYIKFAFLTGVTKFGKVSVFSDLNNLTDISMDHRYISICGMTEKELLTNFKEGISELAEANGDTEEATIAKLKARYDSYQVAGEAELYFQNALYLIFKIMGFRTQVEIPTSDGRMDVLIQTSDYIYIIECKLDGSAEEALQQLESKNYAAPFAMDKRTIIKLGINFSSKTRGVESWKVG